MRKERSRYKLSNDHRIKKYISLKESVLEWRGRPWGGLRVASVGHGRTGLRAEKTACEDRGRASKYMRWEASVCRGGREVGLGGDEAAA